MYFLVGRSLRSVDAIRVRVADISTSDLTERVPVPKSYDEISALAGDHARDARAHRIRPRSSEAFRSSWDTRQRAIGLLPR
jgi:hypothetical protein